MKIKQDGKISQPLMIAVLVGLTLMLCTAIWLSTNKSDADKTESEGENSEAKKSDTEAEHAEEGELQLTTQQMVEQGIKIATVENGLVENIIQLPGKLAVNTDQQAHISPNFSGHVEQVNVALGQTVQKGQTLAVLSVPELIDQQANLRMAEANLDLARQDYQREQKLWSQGISAKQDFQRAENAYRQAQISVQSAQSRLQALGANSGQNGRFIIRAPIAGVISQKDIVVGENVQLADQLFTIEQLKDLWLEFNLAHQYSAQLQTGQNVSFKINSSDQLYSAEVQSLTSQADVQTGRLVVRAKLKQQSAELRPNVMVNVLLADSGPFTGEIAESPWWNDTYSILINHKTCALNYGELIPTKDLKVGDTVNAGDIIGKIRTVLKKDKGRPMSMLHLEMYKLGTQEPIKEWSLNTEKPEQLIDPTDLLIEIAIYRG